MITRSTLMCAPLDTPQGLWRGYSLAGTAQEVVDAC